MKVSLINPPQLFSKIQFAAGVIPPLGLLYLGASLRRAGHEPMIIDSVVESVGNIYEIERNISARGLGFDDIISRIPDDVGLICVTNLFSFAFPIVRALTRRIKEAYPLVPIAIGGAHPSAMPTAAMSEPSIDFCVISEGDKTIIELVDSLGDYEAVKKIEGFAYRDRQGAVRINPKTEFIEDLDSLPYPARDLVALEKYYQASEAHGPTQDRWTPILSSRGCPYQCTFCTSKLWNRRYRARSAENVLNEIQECIEKYNIKEFHFEDENLTFSKNRTMEICKGIIKRGLKIKWQTPNGIRSSVTDAEMLGLMKESGCVHITVAPESGSERVLNEIIRKEQDLSRVTSVVREASKLGIRTAAYFMIGLPGETIKDVKLSIDYACELAKVGLDEVLFGSFVPLPGSELFEKLIEQKRFNKDWESLVSVGDISKAVSWSEHISSRDLKNLRLKAHLKFYLTKGFCYPLETIRSVINVIRRKEELKTERVLITFIKRFKQKMLRLN